MKITAMQCGDLDVIQSVFLKNIKGLFCHVNLIATQFLALRNLWHNLHMFKDILELQVENKKKI